MVLHRPFDPTGQIRTLEAERCDKMRVSADDVMVSPCFPQPRTMNNRVPCIRCGVLILPTTADKTGGLCKPCSGGYRDQLEAARRRYHEEAKTRENDPFVH